MPRSQAAFDFSETEPPIVEPAKGGRTGTFADNMSLPVHRWFRYPAGFSATWVQQVISDWNIGKSDVVLDPFAGSGTTLLAAQKANARAAGAEHHQFVFRIANAKLLWHLDEGELLASGLRLLSYARSHLAREVTTQSALIEKCYDGDTLCRLEALKRAYVEKYAERQGVSEILWLAITSILRECSSVGTAQWQYVLPKKRKARVQEPFAAFIAKLQAFCADMREMKVSGSRGESELAFCDARDLSSLSHLTDQVKLVITSPPYPNNFDYADATRLEMTFWDEIEGWGDLQRVVRHRLIRSCSQHSAAERLSLNSLLSDVAIGPIRDELADVCRQLESVKGTRGGKKSYDTMVAAYFVDLAKVWKALRPLCAEGAAVCFVIGDSAPYGVYVPVERWLGELALAAGFRSFSFEKIRDRNVKWKNRKHRVPLKEGNLWVRA